MLGPQDRNCLRIGAGRTPKVLFQYVNPVKNGTARGLSLADRGRNGSIGQAVARAVVADRSMHQAPIEPPFRARSLSV
jgi:hypothetical protein